MQHKPVYKPHSSAKTSKPALAAPQTSSTASSKAPMRPPLPLPRDVVRPQQEAAVVVPVLGQVERVMDRRKGGMMIGD